MRLFDAGMLSEYEKKDPVMTLLDGLSTEFDAQFVCQQWLLDSLPKRMIYWSVYGDLLRGNCGAKKILDIGGGYTALSKQLLERHDYTLLDIMAHDDHARFSELGVQLGREFWTSCDWSEFQPDTVFDLIICNDLFPNVDQRLDLFLDKYLPATKRLRMTLTYYNTPQFYTLTDTRDDKKEIFNIVAWDGFQTNRVLRSYSEHLVDFDESQLEQNPDSLFANGRQVCLIELDYKGSGNGGSAQE